MTGGIEDSPFNITHADLSAALSSSGIDGELSFSVESISTGTLTKDGAAVEAATTLVSVSDTLVWTPAPNANGSLNAFTIRALNSAVASSKAAQVVVAVSAVNDAPILTAVTPLTGATEDTAFTVTFASLAAASNAADTEGTVPGFRVEAVTSGILTKNGAAVVGEATLLQVGESLVWTPPSNANGTLDAFTVSAHDGVDLSSDAAQVSIVAGVTNDAPVASAASPSVAEDASVAVTLSASDVENSAITYSVVTGPSHGSLSGTAPNLVYTPATNYYGSDSFTFKSNDGALDSNTATISIAVTGVNDAPVSSASSVTTNEDTAALVTLSASDLENNALTYNIVSSPTLGSLSGTAPNLTFTPTANANGSDSFTFKVNDGTADSNTSTVSITITAVNDVPVVTAPSDRVFPLGNGSDPAVPGTLINFAFAATDVESTPSWSSCTVSSVDLSVSDPNYMSAVACASVPGLVTTNGVINKSTASFSGGTFAWTPGVTQRGTFLVTATATDGMASTAASAYLTVRDSYSTTNLLAHLNALFSKESGGIPIGPRLDGTADDDLANWPDLTGTADGLVSSVASSAPWAGTGALTSPYNLTLTAVGNDFASLSGATLNAATKAAFGAWLAPSAPTAKGKVIFTNSDDAGDGFVVRQAIRADGGVELRGGHPTLSEEILSDDPLRYYRLGEASGLIAYDVSDVAVNATLPAANITYGVTGASAGDSDTAITLASSSYISLGSGNDLKFEKNTPFSLELWIKSTDGGTASLISNLGIADSTGYDLTFCGTSTAGCANGGLRFHHINTYPTDAIVVSSAAGLTRVDDGSWHHVAVTYDGSLSATGVKVYVDSVLQPVTTDHDSLTGSTVPSRPVLVGAREGGNNPFSGSIDELAIFPSVLNSTRVAAHYAARNRAVCRSTIGLSASNWTKLKAVVGGTSLQLLLDGLSTCTATNDTTIANDTTAPKVGSDGTTARAWAGKLADVQVFGSSDGSSVGSSTLEASDFHATANRFRATPVEDIVTSSLVWNFDAANANRGLRNYTAGCASSDLTWSDAFASTAQMTLNSFSSADCSGAPADGWKGIGTPSNPYRLRLTGDDLLDFTSPSSAPVTNLTLMGWVRLAALSEGQVVLYLGNSSSNGFGFYVSDGSGGAGNKLTVLMGGRNFDITSSTTTVTTDTWMHFAVTSSSSVWRLYLNGLLQSTSVVADPAAPSSSYIASNMDGDLAIAQFYNAPLSAAQIKQNCLAQQARFGGGICPSP